MKAHLKRKEESRDIKMKYVYDEFMKLDLRVAEVIEAC